jgi:hypothetical protein
VVGRGETIGCRESLQFLDFRDITPPVANVNDNQLVSANPMIN